MDVYLHIDNAPTLAAIFDHIATVDTVVEPAVRRGPACRSQTLATRTLSHYQLYEGRETDAAQQSPPQQVAQGAATGHSQRSRAPSGAHGRPGKEGRRRRRLGSGIYRARSQNDLKRRDRDKAATQLPRFAPNRPLTPSRRLNIVPELFQLREPQVGQMLIVRCAPRRERV